MDQFQISVQENEASCRERCYARMEHLKTEVYSPRSEDPFSDICGEKYSTVFELQKAVQYGGLDDFVDILEKVCSEMKLLLSDILDQVTPAGDSLLHEAAYFGRADIAELIAHHFPQLLTKKNMKSGDTPLHVAAREKRSGVIHVILSQYTALAQNSALHEITRLTNEYGNTALHEAVCSNHVDGVRLLIRADERVTHYLNKSGKSSLYLAVLTGNMEIVCILLDAPFPNDIPLPRCHGNSPLHAAIYAKNANWIKVIVGKKPKLMSLRDEEGGTPLHYAASTGYVEGVRILLNKSAQSALDRNAKGHLPIHLACKWGHIKVVKVFLEQEWPDYSRVLVNQKGQNFLHVAAKKGQDNVVKYLLRNTKLDVNEKDKDGNTSLHLASKNSSPNILFSLTCDKRVHVNIVNNEGLTALDILLLEQEKTTSDGLLSLGQLLSKVILRSAGARKSDKARSIRGKSREAPKILWLKHGAYTLTVVATLIVTVTFAAGLTVPGSVQTFDDPNPGMALLGKRTMFKIFAVSDTMAMFCSTLGSLILMWAQSDGDFYSAKRFSVFGFHMVAMALVAMSLAFMVAVRLVVSNISWLANLITAIGIVFFSFILGLYILSAFPLGSRVPIIRSVSNFLIRIYILVYGSPPKIKSKTRTKRFEDEL